MDHICGFYYVIPVRRQWGVQHQKHYLPQVELKAHTTILSTTSRTTLTQSFINPSDTKDIKQLRYTFPLYAGVSVVGFACHIGDRVIKGVVKEKEKARAVYQEAVDRGETAGLLEQLPNASDVFTTTVGNVPPGARIIVEITYLGELKHDAEVDGIRFTIPTSIAPRYGSYPGELVRASGSQAQPNGGMQITVDAVMSEGSFIKKLQSPSHPIAVSMGTTSTAPDEDPLMTRASATLTLGSCELEKDFVLQIVAKDTGTPKAILETHPTLPHHRALLATLVPKFSLPSEKPEIVFMCDRSGSMSGNKMPTVIAALKVFLKSLPLGVKFNICSFGSNYSFLWPKSVSYSQSTLEEAVRYVEGFVNNYGGTEMYNPLKAIIEQRFKDMPLEVMLLTDGETWNQEQLFSYLNKEVIESKAPIRVFTLGVGITVSHALIEGVARAGNGFAQAVAEDEKLDTKVVRMLKGALSPHVTDYTMEVVYGQGHGEEAPTNTDTDEDDFEIIEKVTDSLKVKLDLSNEASKAESPPAAKKPISLFDTSVDLDKLEPPPADHDGQASYSHLPAVPVPKLLQAPHRIPPLFPFIRTSVYLLMTPDTEQKQQPKSVVLRGTSQHGPLELEIPVQVLEQPGETIHQLAARQAIRELEDGRGWLTEARCEDGTLLREKHEGRFEEMVEREAVRLGVQYQVGGKWCSFVAVEEKRDRKDHDGDEAMAEAVEYFDGYEGSDESSTGDYISQLQSLQPQNKSHGVSRTFNLPASFGAPQPRKRMASGSAAAAPYLHSFSLKLCSVSSPPPPPSGALFGASSSSPPTYKSFSAPRQPTKLGSATFGAASLPPPPGPAYAQLYEDDLVLDRGLVDRATERGERLEDSAAAKSDGLAGQMKPFRTVKRCAKKPARASFGAATMSAIGSVFDTGGTGNPGSAGKSADGFEGVQRASLLSSWAPQSSAQATRSEAAQPKPKLTGDKVRDLIELQTFEGYWEWTSDLFSVIGIREEDVQRRFPGMSAEGKHRRHFATAVAVAFFERRLGDERDVWELVVEKARGWLEGEVGEGAVVELLRDAGSLFGDNGEGAVGDAGLAA